MSDGRGGAAAQHAEVPLLRAYRLWFEHAHKCDGCKRATEAREGCEDGQELWGAYRLARIERAS